RSLVAGQDHADSLVDRLPHAFDEGRVAQAQPRSVRRLNRANRAKYEARGSEALKIHVAREVIAAGAQRFERRRQARLELDETAHRRCRPVAYRYPHALELFAQARPGAALEANDNTVRAFTLFPRLDKACELRVPHRGR